MKINIANLDEGLNELEFEHTGDSLQLTEVGEIGDNFVNPIYVKVKINKVGVQYFLHVFIDTLAYLTCDRCLEKFNQNLNDNFRLVYSTENDYIISSNDENGFRLLTLESTVIDITTDIREALLLMIPMKIICSEDCRGLCPECGVNLNMKECNHKTKSTDPRWDALKDIFDPINKNN